MPSTTVPLAGVPVTAAMALLAFALPATARSEVAGGGRLLTGRTLVAQAAPNRAAVARPSELREVDAYLQVFRQLRSGCENAAWTLWHSNSYQGWRGRRSGMLSMNYYSSFFPTLPPAPSMLPEPLRVRLGEAVQRANDVLREAGGTFKDLANYINAKDYEDDKFRRGDELNAKLVAHGRECHGLYAALTSLYVEVAEVLIERGAAGAARPDLVAAMVGDWRRARELSRELAKGPGADLARLEALVRDVSALAEGRLSGFEAERRADTTLARFYDRMLNEDVAARMRRLLREAKSNPKEFQDAATDRPRSGFWSVRNEIDYLMPDAILHVIRHGK